MKRFSLAIVLLTSIVGLAFLAIAGQDTLANPGVTIGVDADPSSNTATSLGTIETTRTVACGQLFDVDIYVADVSDLRVWSLALRYDPSVVRVVDRDVTMFLAANAGSSTEDMDLSLGDPSSGGSYDLLARDASEDPSAHENGSGVLARLTLQAMAVGSTDLTLSDAVLFRYPVLPTSLDSVSGAVITVEGTCTIPVDVDIRPYSTYNVIRLPSYSVIPVAIVSTADFDARRVDPSTVCFGDAEDPTQRACTEARISARMRHLRDVDRDGDLDLLLYYQVSETGIDPGDTQACLTGETFDGAAIEGCDTVTVIWHRRGHHR